ncbi:MAG: hypothetical protein KDD44_05030 [Bdellovibrionales bacterium]|nr:hypothetical protein [Bdellovibrionales bacterium]
MTASLASLRDAPSPQGRQTSVADGSSSDESPFSFGYNAILPGVRIPREGNAEAHLRFVGNASLTVDPIVLHVHTLNDVDVPFSETARSDDFGSLFSRTRLGLSPSDGALKDIWLIADIRAADEVGILDVPVGVRYAQPLFGTYGYAEAAATGDFFTASLFQGLDVDPIGDLEFFFSLDLPWNKPSAATLYGEAYLYPDILSTETARPYVAVQVLDLLDASTKNLAALVGYEVRF